jgi:hypothetical protein
MKLTKGKISKLYNTKKQSLKKNKNKKSSSRNKTFRKKLNIHLARKSLKRFHDNKQLGGEDREITTPKAEETIFSGTENINKLLPENSNKDISSNEGSSSQIVTEKNNPFEETNTQTPEETPNVNTFEETNKPDEINSLPNVVDNNDVVPERDTNNISSSQIGEKQQNGFDYVNSTAEIMASSGGKKNKSKKNKSKKNKTMKNKTKKNV